MLSALLLEMKPTGTPWFKYVFPHQLLICSENAHGNWTLHDLCLRGEIPVYSPSRNPQDTVHDLHGDVYAYHFEWRSNYSRALIELPKQSFHSRGEQVATLVR